MSSYLQNVNGFRQARELGDSLLDDKSPVLPIPPQFDRGYINNADWFSAKFAKAEKPVPEKKKIYQDVWRARNQQNNKFIKQLISPNEVSAQEGLEEKVEDFINNPDLCGENLEAKRIANLVFAINAMMYFEYQLADDIKLIRIWDLFALVLRNGVMSANIVVENAILGSVSAFSAMPHSFVSVIRRLLRWWCIDMQMQYNAMQKALAKKRWQHSASLPGGNLTVTFNNDRPMLRQNNSQLALDDGQEAFLKMAALEMKSYALIHNRYLADKWRHYVLILSYLTITIFSILIMLNMLAPLFNAVAVLVPIVGYLVFFAIKYYQAGKEHDNYNQLKAIFDENIVDKKKLEGAGVVSEALLKEQMKECENRKQDVRKKTFFSACLLVATLPILIGALAALPTLAALPLSIAGILGATLYLEYKIKKKWNWSGVVKSIFMVVAGAVLLGVPLLIACLNPGSVLVAAVLGAGFFTALVLLPRISAACNWLPEIISKWTVGDEKFYEYTSTILGLIANVAILTLFIAGFLTMPYFVAAVTAIVMLAGYGAWKNREEPANVGSCFKFWSREQPADDSEKQVLLSNEATNFESPSLGK